MPEIVRTFIAVEIPGEVRQRAAQLVKQLQAAPARVRWVEPDHLHWTLKFLGDVDLRDIPAVCDAVTEAVSPLAPFDIAAQGAGAFPTLSNPRTVWIGVGEGSEAMIELHDRIDQALQPLGFRPEGRRFRPHATIGRVRNSPDGIAELGQLLKSHQDFDSGLTTVYEVTIFASELGRDGPTYEPLGHAELLGERE